jgi:threonylcarbamoyladenosine tRNA methylthiotransferase MtaB
VNPLRDERRRGRGVPRVATAFVGCKVSQADSEAAGRDLTALGWRTAASRDEADVCVVMTCCVTAEAEKKSRQMARRFAREGRTVLVAGCAVRRNPGKFMGAGVEIVADGDWATATARLASEQDTQGGTARLPSDRETTGVARQVRREGRFREGLPPANAGRTRFNLKVQDGCAGRCTYCIVRTVRGRPRSLPLPQAVAAARTAVEQGHTEIVLTGINLGAYAGEGGGQDGEARLADLVLALAATPGIVRLRLSSLEPDTVDAALLDALAHPVVARHLHLPLQSGDDGVLRAMGRRYDVAAYRSTLESVRSRLDGVMLSTDVIVGFPTEDEAAFARTLEALRSDLFGRVHVFAYSPRPGTPAERLPRLPASIVKARAAEAGQAAADALRRAAARAVGRPAEVLVEDQRDGLWRGYSSQYVRYRLQGDARTGALVRAVALEARDDGVLGRIEAVLS